MAHDPALLQAILEQPADDQLRLIYADWLDERADPRGEFIRVQLALAGLKHDDPAYRALFEREVALILQHKEEWFPLRQAFTHWECRRGFMDEVHGDAEKFLDVAETLLASNPVRIVRLEDVDASLERLAECRPLGRVEKLFLRNWRPTRTRRSARAPDLRQFVPESPGLSRIPLIEFSGIRGTTDIYQRLQHGQLIEHRARPRPRRRR
ncbi:MAG: TIGR02996 domain-containing protein [Planctomycetia bacterium]|nr:TIGR02996 domain-containing protein [Planctomycetia bacterium]